MINLHHRPVAEQASLGHALAQNLLRIGGAVIFMGLHAERLVAGAWNGVWLEQPWPLADLVGRAGFGSGKAVALAFVVILCLGVPALLLGLFARLAAAGLLLVTGVAVFLKLGEGALEACLLYALILVTVLVAGPGSFSLDALMTRRRL